MGCGRLSSEDEGRGRPHLPGGGVSSEIGEHPGKPVIDLIQSQLPIWSFQNGLQAKKEQRDPQLTPGGLRAPCFCLSLSLRHKERRPIAIGMDQMGGCRAECERWAGHPSKRG